VTQQNIHNQLESERERIAGVRHEETEEERNERLNSDRLRHSLNSMSISSEETDVSQDIAVGHGDLPWVDK
jgi:hypothetical protein